jgi:hypothetical protein
MGGHDYSTRGAQTTGRPFDHEDHQGAESEEYRHLRAMFGLSSIPLPTTTASSTIAQNLGQVIHTSSAAGQPDAESSTFSGRAERAAHYASRFDEENQEEDE